MSVLAIVLFISSAIILFLANRLSNKADGLLNEAKSIYEENQDCEIVQRKWLKSLLEHAESFEEASKEYVYGRDFVNDKIHMEAIALMGYAKSVKYILEKKKTNDHPNTD